MNPEQKAREELVTRLRAHAAIEDDKHSTDLSIAAEEIEKLGRLKKIQDEAFSRKLHKVLADAVHDFVEEEVFWQPRISFTAEDSSLGFSMRVESPALGMDIDVRVRRDLSKSLRPV